MATVCVIPNCGNKIADRSKLKCCANCRGSMGFWTNHRKASDIVKRRNLLNKYNARLVNVSKGKSHRSW